MTLVVFFFALSTAVFCANEVRVDYETMSHYPGDVGIRLVDTAIKSHFEGIVPLSIILNGTDTGVMYSVAVMDYIESIEEVLSKEADVGYILTLNNYLKRMNQILNDGEQNRLPVDIGSSMAAQYYLLYDNSDSQDTRDLIDSGYRNGRIVASLVTNRSPVVEGVIDSIKHIPVLDEISVKYPGVALFRISGHKRLYVAKL